MKKYLVTGGTGFIGRSLVRALIERGCFVRSLDDESRGDCKFLADIQQQIEFIAGDVRDAGVVMRAARGVDCIVHLAYINGTEAFYKKPDVVLDVAVRGMSNVLDAAIKNNVPGFSLASSSEVYQTAPTVPTDESVPLSVPDVLNPRYSYGGGKIISELMAVNYGRKYFQNCTIFRPHNVYGPFMGTAHVIPQLIERVRDLQGNRLQIQGTGEETRAFVYISDFTDGLLRVLERGEHMNVYNIGNPEEVTIAELAQMIGHLFDREIEIVPGELQPGGTLRRCPDISKLKNLGYSPRVSLAKGLQQCVESVTVKKHSGFCMSI
jgi:nucleoside-diphosphate-sugar epimerase